MSEFNLVLVILFAVAGGVAMISGIGLFIMWIKHSWMNRNNSMNYTGRDMAKFVLNKNDLDPQIKSSWFTVKYFNYRKRKNVFKLRPWTHNRKSLWTMMEAAQQSYVASLRGRRGAYRQVFKLPFILYCVSTVVSLALIIALFKFDFAMNIKIIFVAIGFSAVAVITSIAEVIKVGILKKHVVPMLTDSGLNATELMTIEKIYKWRFVYAVAAAIMQILKLVLQASNTNSSNS